jgi:hypothetical protein
MSAVKVRAALESALNGMTPSLATSWENQKFTPPAPTVAYQRVTLLLAQPANVEFGSAYREEGFLQVDLCYPLDGAGGTTGGGGAGLATARAELIRTTFPRGASFTASGVTVHVTKTPEIMPGRVEEDRFVVPVRIPFHSRIGD